MDRPTDDQTTEIQTKILQALTDALGGDYVTKFVCVVEVIEHEDGDKEFWAIPSADLKGWEGLGLLNYAVAKENAAVFTDLLRQD